VLVQKIAGALAAKGYVRTIPLEIPVGSAVRMLIEA
jgi:hypothetical protein